MDVRAVLELCENEAVRVVDIRFIDLLGTWQHFSVPIKALSSTTAPWAVFFS